METVRNEPEVSDFNRPTESLCPVCLATVPAALVGAGDDVVLEGRCPDHGAWKTLIWSGPPSWESWCGEPAKTGGGNGGCTAPPEAAETAGCCGAPAARPEVAKCCEPAAPAKPAQPTTTRCPGECGLCAQHQQRTCTAVVEVTRRCDLGCPVCFAESTPDGGEPDPAPELLLEALDRLFAAQGAVNLQFSGGEPTLRADLPALISDAHALGFTFVQLNTNGLRLASDTGYAEELADAGLDSVFLQFDGLSDDTYRALRGRPLVAQKLQALENCARAGLAVVLVPTVVPGVNEHELGALVDLAAEWPGAVRGLHLQPVSYFGRYSPGERRRLTLPEVLRFLEEQTGGKVHASDFAPSSCEHTRCSFRARYWVREGGGLEPFNAPQPCCTPEPTEAARRAIAATSRQWARRRQGASGEVSTPGPGSAPGETPGPGADSESGDGLGRFLTEMDKTLTVSGMMFQDAWNLDLERVRRCCVHVVVPERGLVPFCLWNLTSASDQRLYPR
jgi:uncharacterized radical SAM superfamily Fe-S cluster-containing enzyme